MVRPGCCRPAGRPRHGYPLGHRLEHRDAAQLTRRRRADVGAGAQRVQRPDGGVSTSGTPVVSNANSTPAPAGGVPDRLDRVDVVRGDQVGGAELRGERQARGAAVDRDDRRRRRRSRAAMIAQSPTEPAPKTAMDEPGRTRSTSSTVPAPVCTPQASGPAMRRSTSSGTGTTLRPLTTASVPKEDWPKKWSPTGAPAGVGGADGAVRAGGSRTSAPRSSRSTPSGRCGTGGTRRTTGS